MNHGLRLILALSIALNVLLAGVLIGDMSHRLINPCGFNVSEQLDKLSREKRALFENTLKPAKEQMDVEHIKMDEAKKEAVRLLKAEPFDEAAYMKQLAYIGELHAKMKQQLAKAIVTLAKQLNVDERNILAEIISHPPFTLPPPPAQLPKSQLSAP